jgi:cyclophilin family peptidyl-prolyl cis-trans isomerase
VPTAGEIGKELKKPVTVKLATTAGEVSVVLDPELAPITATRIASLARAGFYKGIVVHRVVPGFVVQLGDPDGDGYGGCGALLRCETSPVPFKIGDVGMALAGRDTGSSQFFVTLARAAHLDGEYARIGHASGDWAGLAEGDVITDVKVEE